MISDGGKDDSRERRALRAQVEFALARPDAALKFPGRVEARYQADRAVSRSQELRSLCVRGAALFAICGLFINFSFVDDATRPIGFAITGIAPVFILAFGRWGCGPEVPAFSKEARTLALLCAVALAPFAQTAVCSRTYFVAQLFLMGSAIVGSLFFARMPFNFTAAFLLFCVAIAALTGYWRAGDVGPLWNMPAAGQLISGAFALHAYRDHARAERRLYLHQLAQSLHIEDLAARNQALDALSSTDPLTGAGNRRVFDHMLEHSRPPPGRSHFLLLIDIDQFKRVNDTLGHPAGDACLKTVAAILHQTFRDFGRIARIGGDEFVVLLTDIAESVATGLAQRLTSEVAARGFEFNGRQHPVSVTIGGAPWPADRRGDEVFAKADEGLYRAKRAGRRGVTLPSSGAGAISDVA